MLFRLRVGPAPELRRATGELAVKFVDGARRRSCFAPAANRVKTWPMRVKDRHFRSIWVEDDSWSVGIIDQTKLPHGFETLRLASLDDAAHAIKSMQVRGAPLIGATAAYGVCLALRADASDEALERAYAALIATRPTAINLKWALDEMMAAVRNRPREDRLAAAYRRAAEISDEDVAINQAIGAPWAQADRGDCRQQEAGRARQRADPLQCRLACDGGLRHGHRADLSRP